MNVPFFKYQGTGNDFILIDNRSLFFPKNDTKLIERLCDRRFGIGADGLILLESDKISDFKMVYYNSDGRESTLCGNGGRCIVAFANRLGVIGNQTTFLAVDGIHYAEVVSEGQISLQMHDVTELTFGSDYVFLNTGSPHHICLVDSVADVPVKELGREIRYSALYGAAGSNVNFVEPISDSEFAVRTYERGVEDETLSCGTGVTAAAIALNALGKTHSHSVTVHVPGGTLEVSYEPKENQYTRVFLKGPATFVFEGVVNIKTD